MITKEEVERFEKIKKEYRSIAKEELSTDDSTSSAAIPDNISDYVISELSAEDLDAWNQIDITGAVSNIAGQSSLDQCLLNSQIEQLAAVRWSKYEREMTAKYAVELWPETFPGVKLPFNDFAMLCAMTNHGKSSMASQSMASLALRGENSCCVHLEQKLSKSARDIILNIMALGNVSEMEATKIFSKHCILIEGIHAGYSCYDTFVEKIKKLADPTRFAVVFIDTMDKLIESSQGVKDRTPDFQKLNTVLAQGLQKEFLLADKLHAPVLFLKQIRNQVFVPSQLGGLPENLTRAKVLCETCTSIFQYSQWFKPKLDANGKVDKKTPPVQVGMLGIYKVREPYYLGPKARENLKGWMYAVPRKSKFGYGNVVVVSANWLQSNTDLSDETVTKEVSDIVELIGV